MTKEFFKRLTPQFYKLHESFLSTPLLAIMLMLTFEEYAEIPDSLHAFYRNAFDTLVRRHDAMKAQFLRRTHSNCSAEDFKGLFASFCLLTYSKSKYQFSHEEIIEYIKQSLKQQRIKGDPEKILNDLIESICLLQREGFEISFVHRSFQEYFCALFVSQAPAGIVSKYLESGKFRVRDNVLPMLFGMVPDRVEMEWAAGVVKMIVEEFKGQDDATGIRFLQSLFKDLNFLILPRSEVSIAMGHGTINREFEILRRIYPAHFFASESKRRDQNRASAKVRNAEILEQMERLEQSDDENFKGFSRARKLPPGPQSGEIRTFTIDISIEYSELLVSTGFVEYAKRWLIALRAVHKDQIAHEKGDDDFLTEVFR